MLPRAPAPSAETAYRPAYVAIFVLGLLGIVTVVAIRHTRQEVRATIRGAPVQSEFQQPVLFAAEMQDVAAIVAPVTTGAVETAIGSVLANRERQRHGPILYTAFRSATSKNRAIIRDRLAQLDDPLAIAGLVDVLREDPDPSSDRRPRAARRLLEMYRSFASGRSCPDPHLVRDACCEVLLKQSHSGRNEDALVLLAAIRGLGWLADPLTGSDCLRAMDATETAIVGAAISGEELDRAILDTLDRIPNAEARDRLGQRQSTRYTGNRGDERSLSGISGSTPPVR